MMEYKLEKGIPIPKIGRRGRLCSYPFGDMAVGDSFAMAATDRKRVSTAASCYGTRNGKKFCVRKFGDAYRVWRIA